jgi:ribosomal protein L30E
VNPQEVYEKTLKSLTDYLYHLISLCHKTGITVIGQDNIKKLKEGEGTLLLSKELSPKTKERLKRENWLVLDGIFSSQELGNALRRETSVGALLVEKVGLGRKLFQVASKVKELSESKRD